MAGGVSRHPDKTGHTRLAGISYAELHFVPVLSELAHPALRESGATITSISAIPMKELEATFEMTTFHRDRAS
jgi:hypothetical protein